MNGSGIASDTPPTSSFDISSKYGDSGAVANSSHPLDMTSDDPAVQHPTSDLREQASPVSEEQVKQIKELKQQQDLARDPELANGITNGSDVPIERTLTFELEQPIADENAMDIFTAHDDSKPEDSTGADIEMSMETAHTSHLPDHPPILNLDGSEVLRKSAPTPTPTAVGSALGSLAIDTAAMVTSSSPQPVQVMQDFSKSSAKLTRSREESEGEEAPAAKRSRTDGEGSQAPEFRIPDLPQTATVTNENGPDAAQPGSIVRPETSLPITKSQQKFLLKGLQNIRRLKDANAFNNPVDYVALNIPSYPDVIKRPMDLKRMEEKIKKEQYPSVDAYIADFDQVVQNSLTFNGAEHPVSVSARSIRGALDKQISNLPGPDVAEPSPVAKKSKKGPVVKAAPARRESRSSIGHAKSPTAASSPQTFALGPEGVPLIRRDSTVTDGRPKRLIHPPAPRDLPYANQKPKKKKFQLELRFCHEVLSDIKGKKYQVIAFPFVSPVDPVALNIPHYHKIIKKPMDLSTIEKNLIGGQYENAKEFEGDVRLMFSNCYKFNPPSDAVHTMGKELEQIFDTIWARKKQWIEEHAPASGPQSPRSSPELDDDDEEEEEEEEDQDEPDNGAISAMEKQIADMAKAVEQMKKRKSSPPVPAKKPTKGGKPAKKDVKRASVPAPVKTEKKGASKPAKVKRIPIVTYDQKQDISNRINSLPENRMANALAIIRDNMPNLKVMQTLWIEICLYVYLDSLNTFDRVFRKTRLSSTLMNCRTRCFISF